MIFICASVCVAGGPCKASDAPNISDAIASQTRATRRLTCECDIDQPPSARRGPHVRRVRADIPFGFPRISRTTARTPNTNRLRAVNGAALRYGIEPKRQSPCKAMLPLCLERMKLSSVNVAQQPLEPHAPEQPPTAHGLERLFDGEP